MSAARVSPRLLAVLLTVAASSWTAAIFFAPLAHAATPIAASAVNVTASFVCHQRDERSFHLRGERLEIYPFLGSSRLAETIDRFKVNAIVHGHAHRGRFEGRTPGGQPVYNVAKHIEKPTGKPYAIIEI